jgi:predicted hydrocarbon binding protein
MTDTFRPGRFGLTLSPRVLQQLRASLERDTGFQAASYLQEAGFAGGEGLYAAFAAWLGAAYGLDRPADLDARYLGEALSAFLTELGWGSVSVAPLGDSALAIDSGDWAEATGEAKGDYPACHLTCGLLADFLGRISEGLVAVMEVECRSRGDARCRFLAGSPETLGTLYDRMAQGMSYDAALGAAGAGTGA